MLSAQEWNFIQKFLIWNQHSMPQHLLLKPLYNQHVQTLPPHYSSTLSSNQVGLLLKQITIVCPVKLSILREILSQPLFSISCFTPTVQDHVSIPTCYCGMIRNRVTVLCSITMLFRFSSVCSFCIGDENWVGHGTYGIINILAGHTNVSFINFFFTLLLSLLNSLYFSTRFTHIFRLP